MIDPTLIALLLQQIGEDPDREGLRGTPDRVRRAGEQLFAGYKQDPKTILKAAFTEGACHEMVVLRDIQFYSTCEHHLMPFFGTVSIAYLPGDAVVGVSKLARLVDCFARRLQIQERLVGQVADAIMEHLKPKGVMVVAKAQHLCMSARGVEKQNSMMVTSAIRGSFEEAAIRAEALSFLQ